jgi:sensor histidine kinase regulating citrate/malate metabolism
MLQEIRMLRHDYKYQISVIEELAVISNARHISEFLESSKICFNRTEPVMYCENLVMNALITNYMERFAGNDIPFQVQATLPSDINRAKKPESLDNYEICIVLGNLLENSLEGTMTAPREVRQVSLAVGLVSEQLLIEVQNTFDGKLVLDNRVLKKLKDNQIRLPLSRKRKKGGYGIKSILAVCKRHGGEYLPQWTESEYTVRVLLNV